MAEPIVPVPLPSVGPSPSIEPVETPPTTPPPRKRRRWIGVLIALVVVAALLVVGFFVADRYAKTYAENYVRERIVEVLKLDPASDVEVDVGTGSVLLQAALGALDEVTVHVDPITFGDISGTAVISATKVPLDSSVPLETLDIQVTVSEENVKKLSSFMSGIDLTSIELKNQLIRVGTEFDLFFFTIPVSVDLNPTAHDGGINFDPVTILLGKDEISVADLRSSPQFSALAGSLLASRDFCVAEFLPQALTVKKVEIVGKTLVLSINGDGTALSDPALSTLGTCPASG
ncbi:MAG: DUF2993 domain-containing protein [Salinibacterium sp.]|nr:DUF2993 domain-containing protein [Salinibacterium sp.]